MRAVRQMIGALLISILFLCVYSQASVSAYAAKTAVIRIDCAGVEGIEGDSYHVTLSPDHTNNPERNKFPEPAKSSILIPEGTEGKFELKITQPGTYTYKLVEVPGSIESMEYDATEYLVTVYVEVDEKTGELTDPAIIIASSTIAEKPDKAAFRHVLAAAETTTDTTTVSTASSTTASTTTASTTTTNSSATTKKTKDTSPIATGDDATIYTSSPTSAPIAVDEDVDVPGMIDGGGNNVVDVDPNVSGTHENPQHTMDSGNGSINTKISYGDEPQTHDTTRVKAYVIILCCAAVVAVISGSIISRRLKAKKNAAAH